MELHLITLCAVLLAIEPASKLKRQITNWWTRQKIHKEHLKKLEAEHG